MSIKRLTRYPSYDVMSQRHEWDEHTRRIVLDRLQTGGGYTFLTAVEAENLRAWCCLLLDDERPEIIQFVLDHIDTKMNSGQESQRKPGEPPAPALVRNGLQALDSACQRLHTKRFFSYGSGAKEADYACNQSRRRLSPRYLEVYPAASLVSKAVDACD